MTKLLLARLTSLLFIVIAYAGPLWAQARLTLNVVPTGNAVTDEQRWTALANRTQTKELVVTHRGTFEGLATSVCGPVALSRVWSARAAALNNRKAQDSISIGEHIRIPLCPFWTGPVRITTRTDISLRQLLEQRLGSATEDIVNRVAGLNHLSPNALVTAPAGTSVLLPYSLVSRDAIPLEDRQLFLWMGRRPNTAASSDPLPPPPPLNPYASGTGDVSVGDEFAGPGLTGQLTTALRLIDSIALTPASSAVPCVGPQPQQAWPYDLHAVMTQLARNRTFPRSVTPQHTVIAIIDTGIAANESRLPIDINVIEQKGKNNVDDEPNGFVDDILGANMDHSAGDPLAFAEYSGYEHGTHVAALAAGGVVEPATMLALAKFVGLRILNIVSARTDTRSNPPRTLFEVPPSAMAEALSYVLDDRTIRVANLSVETVADLSVVRRLAGESPGEFLRILAAGNDALDLDVDAVFPAAYSTSYPRLIITVGAHDANGRLAPFSNYGQQTVNVLAPGCLVTSAVPSGLAQYSGTSQAAPIVSFVAALLSAEGLPAAAVRNRILSTVDLDPALVDTVSSSGRLNIPNALAVYEDVVTLKSGEVLRGTVRTSELATSLGRRSVASVLRVTPAYNTAAKPDRLIVRRNDGVITTLNTKLLASDIDFEPRGETNRLIRLTDVTDIMFAYYRP